MRGSLGSNLSLLFTALICFPQSSELCGQVFEEYVTVEFGVELCGQVFEEYVAVEFGGVRQSSAGKLCGKVFKERNIFVSSGDKRTLSWMSFGRDFPSTMSLDRLL